ncbi:MAG TPA: cytochrome c-type biogenesis CcmF C-terminal domain-containing protein, partial [Burkholderiales bacterium]|nr:cytochrome c-type biogenesis CcmF C-terminal domain-containing protein [Burkholderiales bacterium]
SVFVPLMAPAILLMGIGPIAKWQRDAMDSVATKLALPALVAVVASAIVPLFLGRWSALVFLGLLLAFWVVVTTFVTPRLKLAGAHDWAERRRRLATQSRAWWGMLVAHFGIAVFILGVTVAKGYEQETDVRMSPGDTTQLAGYTFALRAMEPVNGPNYTATRATVDVTRDGAAVAVMTPEKRLYTVQNMPLTDSAIDAGVWRHLYVSMGEPLAGPSGERAWIMHIQFKPLVGWIWSGCLLMALGGGLAASDRRYRITFRKRAAIAGNEATS